MSYLLGNDHNPRLDKTTGQPMTMDSVLVFCILISETPKVDGTPNYAKTGTLSQECVVLSANSSSL